MKKWRCIVCGYEYQGEAPPVKCPICGVGPEQFMLEEEALPLTAAETTHKRWKCIVCDYVHTGAEPPETCPLCGVGKENFMLLEDAVVELTTQAVAETTSGTVQAALDKLTYGLYVLTSIIGTQMNGQCVNTIFQLTSQPPRIAICLNKNNLTHEYVTASGVFAVSILGQSHFDKVRAFGYQSGRNVDKFAGVRYVSAQNGCPILADCLAYLEARILPDKTVDVGTHTLFVADITAGRVSITEDPLTYSFYRTHRARN
jgi:flavin reductase (DIM6/NTAB) family NADH-FMN oxidoreductase RutF/rubredoxin